MATKNENPTAWTATHPGTILKYELEERGISQKDFAIMIDMQKSHLNELIKGKRPMTSAIADRIEEVLGLSSVSLVNLQTQYDYDARQIEIRGTEEQNSVNILRRYDEVFSLSVLFKRMGVDVHSAKDKVEYLINTIHLPQPAELQMEAAGRFRKSAKTGQDSRMLMTWKILAEYKARTQSVDGTFNRAEQNDVVEEVSKALHQNHNVENNVKALLSHHGIAFCTEEKVEKASIDGYSYIEGGTPYIILTKRFDRIDNFAFALMHELGHIYLHYSDNEREKCKLSIPDYDNESPEEREANEFAAKVLIPNMEWRRAPKVRVNPLAIQRKYTAWAEENSLNKWIVLGRISYETGMYKFKSDESRKIR